MAKTVAEWRAKHEAETKASLDAHHEALEMRRAYVSRVEAREIPAYENTQLNSDGDQIDMTDYARCGVLLRHKIRCGDGVGFIDLVCDDCGTYLFDEAPVTLSSNPPKFWAGCCGCGRKYALELAARRRVRDAVLVGDSHASGEK